MADRPKLPKSIVVLNIIMAVVVTGDMRAGCSAVRPGEGSSAGAFPLRTAPPVTSAAFKR